jgi:hypothetical protein
MASGNQYVLWIRLGILFAAVFQGVDGGYGSYVSISHAHVELELVMISWSICSGMGEVCVSDDRCFSAVFSTSGEAMTSSMVVSISRVKTLGLTFGGCTWQWRLTSRFLVEGIVWSLDLLQGENLGFNMS